MNRDELKLLRQRLNRKQEQLTEAENTNDQSSVSSLSAAIELINVEIEYFEKGGETLKTSDDLLNLSLLIKEKNKLLERLEKQLKSLPDDDINLAKYSSMERILKAQIDYLNAKHTILSENRNISELGRWLGFAEKEGVKIISTPLEHQAELELFKPAKHEKQKTFVIEFKKIAIVLTLLLIIAAFYMGVYWRKTPYDREIIRAYVVANNVYVTGNADYTSGNYTDSEKKYLTAAAYFNKAKTHAGMAASSQRGKMKIYFGYKEKFFTQWEAISLEMAESSRDFISEEYNSAADHAVEAVNMAKIANDYNRDAEEAWRLL